MTCSNCARKVTNALQSVKGVSTVTADPESGLAVVRPILGSTLSVDGLIEAVRLAGYPASQDDSSLSDAHPETKTGKNWSFWIGVPVTLSLMIAEWGFGLGMQTAYHVVALILALPVQFFVGAPFYRGAWRQICVGETSMDTLVSLGSSSAFGYSLWGLAAGGHGHLYFMEASAILTLVSVGHSLEARMSRQAAGALRGLLKLAPTEAWKQTGTGEIRVPIASLRSGDIVVLKPGDRVPVDATVMGGESSVDESMLTGEAVPVEKGSGSPLYAGTLNQTGRIVARVTATGETTALARIVAAVQRAQSSRAQVQRLADRISQVFVPIVVGLAVVTALAWGLGFAWMSHFHDLLVPWLWSAHLPTTPSAAAWVSLASVLIVACPCAMGLATPVALMAGLNAATRRGILIRDAPALEKSGRITTVIFDKTGTLTEGRPTLTDHVDFRPTTGGTDIVRLAGELARPSMHPVSRALTTAASRLGVPISAIEGVQNWREVRGCGVEAHLSKISLQTLRLGSVSWLSELGVDTGPLMNFASQPGVSGATVLGLAIGTEIAGGFAVRDPLKAGARDLIQQLRSRGLEVRLLTGDQPAAAAVFGASVGLSPTEISAGIRPEGKSEAIRQLQEQGRKVAFVGDGLNDGPALAQADLGIAVSQATDIARDAADIVLLRADLEAIPVALNLARSTLRVIHQNLFWAFFYNAAAIPLAMLGYLSPVVCALAMGLSDVVVVGNALRLARNPVAKPAK